MSKELNLDNRDILDVCEQLNIPAKSHSSTISADEAKQIRSAAATRSPNAAASRSVAPSSTPKPRKNKPQPPIKKPKQQILEIRRQRPTAVPEPKRPDISQPQENRVPDGPKPEAPAARDNTLGNGGTPTPAPVAPPPRPVPPQQAVKPAAVGSAAVESAAVGSDVAPAEDAEPTKPIAEQPVAPQLAEPPTPPVAQKPIAIKPEKQELAEPPEPDALRPKAAAPAPAPQPPAPTLIGPPTKVVGREEAERDTKREAPTSSVSRPILKKPSQLRQRSQGTDNGGNEQVVIMKRGGDRDKSAGIEAPVKREKPRIELRKKPVRPAETTQDDSEAKTTDEAGIALPNEDVLELKRPERPAPPKTAKRGRRRDDDEEERKDTGKVAKTTKNKRRSQVQLDEDIDLDEALDGAQNGDSAMASVRMSLARPPKPKSNKPPAKPAAVAAPKKKSSSSSDSRSNRRDRREQPTKERPEIITLNGDITVAELADRLVVPETDIIKTLFLKGIMATVNQMLDVPTATMVAEEFEVLIDTEAKDAEAKKTTEMLSEADMEHLQRRPPVVTIMGHVDHGKTTLLDSIRKTKVAQGEAGGITQHIGAYHVDVDHENETKQVVFLDTPGHEAFTAMRARGARVTDVAILVVAADDGVRPQTIEAISHAKAAEVPIVVAINKMDKEQAQPDRVKQELMEHNLVPEEWGGDTIMVPVSAISGDNLDTLLEMILLVTEVEDLYANPDRPAKGTVIEANLDKAKGPVATLLVQNGILRVGDVLVAGHVFGKVRAMVDDRGDRVKEATPSFAVEVLGLSDVPAAGDEFDVYRDEKEARATADRRADEQRQSRLQQAMASRRVSLNTLSSQAQEGDLKELNIVLKADVQGSVEAILASLQQLPQKEVQVRVLLAAPGEITETDVDLAAASNAVILGFNTTFASGARRAADDAGVDVRDYTIIYKLLEDVQGAMEGLLEPELVEEPLGQVEVRAVFPVGRGAVAGCYVQSGKILRNCRMRVRRKGDVIHEGNLDSLKRMRDDVKEVASGFECGIGSDDFKNWQEGDIIEAFRLVTKRRTLTV
ncbi:MAG: translation initiation factor IF-2 [Cyanobacteria bacterium J06638_22]